jgi:probable F420-dependent oxidoreductase
MKQIPPRPFRFGVHPPPVDTPAEWRALTRKIESLGYTSLLVPDHVGTSWAPLIALAAAADAADTLTLGTLVVNADLRNPVLLAKEVATVDVLSSGRLEFGMGAGWSADDYAASGVARAASSKRIERMRESLQIMKALWRDGQVVFDGEHFHVRCEKYAPMPVSRPWPSLCIGGGGRAILEVAAVEADIISLNPDLSSGVVGAQAIRTASPDWYARRVDWVLDAAGPRAASLEFHCMIFWGALGRSAPGLIERLASRFGIDDADVQAMPIVAAGSVDEITEALLERRERFGISYVSVYDADMFAPVVSRLAGQ